jgi:hypothetical protein
VLCDENGIGGDGEYSGDNDAQLDRINVFYHWARLAIPCGKPREPYAREKNGPKTTTKGSGTNYFTSPFPRSVSAHTSALITFLLARNARACNSARLMGYCEI